MFMESLFCLSCRINLDPTFHFCPNCGEKIKDMVMSTSLGKQIGIYLLSIFLPPFGLWPGIKYLRQTNQKAQIIGTVAIILTVVSIGISLWMSISLLKNVQIQVKTQLEQYSGL